jgi:hypothetical protein
MATMPVKDANGTTVDVEKPLIPGRSAAVTSRPVVLSNEDVALLTTIDSSISAVETSVDALEARLGIETESAPASDTASSGLNGRLQRVAQNLTTVNSSVSAVGASVDTLEAKLGVETESAPASDTASSGLNGRLQRIAQNLTTWLTTLGAKTDAKSTATDATSVSLMQVIKQISASVQTVLRTGGVVAKVTATYTRPADTTAYAAGDLSANSTAAGSVVPMTFAISRVAGYGGAIRKARLKKSGTSVTNAQFRLHLYSSSPTPSNGDNGAYLTDKAADYAGSIDFLVDKVFTDGASGNGVPNVGSEINFTADTYHGLMEVRGAYTGASSEVFVIDLEIWQN